MLLLVLILYITLCLLVGTIGSGRKIGFFPAFVFSILLSPLIGWLIALAYPKLEKTHKRASAYDNLLNLSMNSYNQGNYDAAIKILEDAILKFNTEPEAYLRLGSVYAKQEKIDLAIKNVAKAKQLGVNSLELVNEEPFNAIRSTKKWIDFIENDYQLEKDNNTQKMSSADAIIKLGELLEKGLITREEFDAEKSKILK